MDEEIVERLERIERRLEALEARPAPVARQPVPPIYYSSTPPPPPPPTAVGASPDLETVLGSRWLPRAGALAIVAAIAYLVALGLQRGWITPAMVVLGIAAACVGTISLGLRLKDAREAFGHVLVGIGIGGLYVDAVAAHFYQNLLGSEAMVGACVAISLAALGYGLWRALPSFLGVGLSGGLVAALMPLDKGATATSAGLLLLVAIPTFSVAAGRRWPTAVAATWLACFVASLTILAARGPMLVRLLPLDAVLLIAVAASAVAGKRFSASDPQGAFPLVAAAMTGVAAVSVYRGVPGAEHLLSLAAICAVIGALFRSNETGRRVILASALLAGCLAPVALEGHQIDLAFGLIATAVGAAAFRFKSVAPFAAVEVVLALAAYVTALVSGPSIAKANEIELLGLLTLATILASSVLNSIEVRVGAGVFVWGLATRFAVIGLEIPDNASVTVAWIAVCAGLLAVGFLRQKAELRQLGLAVAATTVAKVVLVDLAGLDSALKAVILLGLGLVLLAGGYAYVRRDQVKGNLDG